MPHKQTRKIIRIGNSLGITIPKPWLDYFQLSENDYVTVLSNGAIVVKREKRMEEETPNVKV
jgi:antitoxin component of MazEF toxin-antitoxin module